MGREVQPVGVKAALALIRPMLGTLTLRAASLARTSELAHEVKEPALPTPPHASCPAFFYVNKLHL